MKIDKKMMHRRYSSSSILDMINMGEKVKIIPVSYYRKKIRDFYRKSSIKVKEEIGIFMKKKKIKLYMVEKKMTREELTEFYNFCYSIPCPDNIGCEYRERVLYGIKLATIAPLRNPDPIEDVWDLIRLDDEYHPNVFEAAAIFIILSFMDRSHCKIFSFAARETLEMSFETYPFLKQATNFILLTIKRMWITEEQERSHNSGDVEYSIESIEEEII